ncbi:MAG: glycosyltransferase [Acidimicrobiales bacterium]
MEELAPSVAAVVVAHDPGPSFEVLLGSLSAQNYGELAVLVLDSGSAEDLTARVAPVLPAAYVRRFEENRGFGPTANEVVDMVGGADYFLLCHDDVALGADAVHLMVEEAFRSNAGIVSSKVVSWDDPAQLVHVGMTVDKSGSVVERVQPLEIDHGQHDAVRDVFVAPGGVTLVRADLFGEIGGFDPAIVAMGEDLDLCWRAQVAGARVIVAPDALVRHREELASGTRPVDPTLVTPMGETPAVPPVTLQELQRRHELLAVFKCYGLFHLIRIVPQLVVLSFGEVIVAGLSGNQERARAVVRAWRWNLGRVPAIRRQRAEVRSYRRLGDREIRQLQLSGSARLSAYGRRVVQVGFRGAHGEERSPAAGSAVASHLEQSESDNPGRGRLVAWLLGVLVAVIGTRGLLTGGIPVVGQFVPFPRWSATFTAFATGWHPTGLGTTAPSTPALAMVGLVATVLLGAMGLTGKVLILGCVPVGVWGVARLVRPFRSPRGPVVAGLTYLAMAVPYDALSQGRWDALIVYAGAPWVLLLLFRASGADPYGTLLGPAGGGGWRGRIPLIRSAQLRRVLVLGLLEAVMVSFVPAAAIVVVLAAVALVLSSSVIGEWRAMARSAAVALSGSLLAGVLCLPWLIGSFASGGALSLFGVPVAPSQAPPWGSLLRFASGPIGDSPLAWGFAAAAGAVLMLSRAERFRWAFRLWSLALLFWLAAWTIGRGWVGSLAVDTLVLLAPAAAALAAAIGIGMSAFEEDLPSSQFGWRQVVAGSAALLAVLGALPTVVSALPGRWDLPYNDFNQSVTWMRSRTSSGAFRVLWLGDPRALNQGSWSAGGGLAYATSEDGAPDARWLWVPGGAGPASKISTEVDLARSGRTDRLGHLLASFGIRYVVLVTALAPEITGEQSPATYPVPPGLAPALARQLDLSEIVSGTGITVYGNTDWLPQVAELPAGRRPVSHGGVGVLAGRPGTSPVPGARPVLTGTPAARAYRGPVSAGTVFAAFAPSGSWVLTQAGGTPAHESQSFGWAARYRVTRPGPAVLGFEGGITVPITFVASLLTWLVALVALLGRRPTASRRRRSEPDRAAGDGP